MNDRITELAKQAEIKFEAELHHLGIDTAVIVPSDLEKFYKLIVNHAVEVVRDTVRDETSSLGWEEASDLQARLRTYFGVE
jgi:hypothetical protein